MMTDEEKHEEIRLQYLSDAEDNYAYLVDDLHKVCESPIEKLFASGLVAETLLYDRIGLRVDFVDDGDFQGASSEYVTIIPQHKTVKYRVDFYFEVIGHAGPIKLAVECDGHDFHERTKEQARRDRSMDRWLQSQGIAILRFTGSEIWKDARECAAQAIGFVTKRYFF